MKFPGSVGVMIIIISFLGCSFISAIYVTPITNEEVDYHYKNINDIHSQKPSYETSSYKYYSIPDDDRHENIPLNDSNDLFLHSEVTLLKKFLNSLKYSENCKSITVKINSETKTWDEYSVKYPITPFLCAKGAGNWLRPIELNNITFNYKIGDSVIYPVNSNSLSIDKTFIAHHQDQLGQHNFTSEFLSIKSSDIIQWSETCFNTEITTPVINIKDINPEIQYYKVHFQALLTRGDEITINGQSFPIYNGKQILLGSNFYDFKNIDIIYKNDTCYLQFCDTNMIYDLSPIIDYKIIFKGDWDVVVEYYEGHPIQITEYKWNMNPLALFQINNSYIVTFIGITIILSGICSYSIGLNFIDWAVIISIIAFILIAW